MKAKWVLSAALFAAVLGLIAVVVAVRSFAAPNVRIFIRGPIVLLGNLDRERFMYDNLSVGDWDEPYDGSMAFDVRLPNGELLSFPQVDAEKVKAMATSSYPSTSLAEHRNARLYVLPGMIGNPAFVGPARPDHPPRPTSAPPTTCRARAAHRSASFGASATPLPARLVRMASSAVG